MICDFRAAARAVSCRALLVLVSRVAMAAQDLPQVGAQSSSLPLSAVGQHADPLPVQAEAPAGARGGVEAPLFCGLSRLAQESARFATGRAKSLQS